MEDDRRSCTTCRNLDPARENGDRNCAAARRGELAYLGQSRRYSPYLGHPRRCEAYLPKPADPDQRTGAERWPSLVAPTNKRLRWPRTYRYRLSAERVAELYAEAEVVAARKRPYRKANFMSSESEYVGLAGEVELGAFLGVAPRFLDQTDDGWDFDIGGTRIDAKTSRNPVELVQPTNKVFGSAIYVQLGYDDAFRQAVVLKWDYAEPLMEAPTKWKKGDSGERILCHYLPLAKVRFTVSEWPAKLYGAP